MKMFSRRASLVFSFVAFITPGAFAGTVYDASLGAPGVYFGSGHVNNHYTVNTTSGTELGLTTVERFVGNYTPNANSSVYDVPLGNTTYPGKQGSVWGFTFSLNDGPGGPTLKQITTSMTITDVLTGSVVTFNPLTALPDNTGYDPSGVDTTLNPTSDYAFQNSEALSFTNGVASAFDPTYNSALNDTFIITFSAECTDACVGGIKSHGSVTETVVAGAGAPAPEPASMATLGVGFLAIGGAFVSRRRSRRA